MSRSAYYLSEIDGRGCYDSVNANQLREFNEEGLHDWRREMTRRLDAQHPLWRSMFENVEEAAEVLFGESPYAEY